jgi:CMP/dCMP kinase
VVEAQRERDVRDRGREHSPLQRAPDAVELDTTGQSADEVVKRVVALAHDRGLA